MRSAVSILFILGALMAECLSLLGALAEEEKRNRVKAWGMFAFVMDISSAVISVTVANEILRAKAL